MGTPSFAVPALERLAANRAPGMVLASGYELVTVITRPDKPVGRGREIVFSPVKQAALALDIPVWQPGSLKRPENIEALAALQADLFIVAAFGQILPQVVLDLPRYGTLNIHASLLPRYRGVSPISEAILQGDHEAGVTIMLIDAGIDTGHMLLKRSIAVAPDETTGSLTEKLAQVGADSLQEVLPLWISGELTLQPQDERQATYTRMMQKADGLIDWSRSAEILARRVRAYQPWPGAYTHWRSKLLKILAAHPLADQPGATGATRTTGTQAGTAIIRRADGQTSLLVATGDGMLAIDRLQLEGKKAVSAEEFIRGYPQIAGDILK
jgi:methionyl-tRNA formyltransferase